MAPLKEIHSDAAFDTEFSAACKAYSVVVVDFSAEWCGPCKALFPQLERLASYYPKVGFLKVDVDECPKTASSYSVRAMPTIIIFKDRRQVAEVVGANVAAIEAEIKKHHSNFNSFAGTGRTLGDATASAPAPAPAPSPATVPASKTPEPAKLDAGECEIQIRLGDGTTLRNKFKASEKLSAVKDYVLANSKLKPATTFLMTNLPKHVYDGEELDMTLEEAKLTPRALLIITNKK